MSDWEKKRSDDPAHTICIFNYQYANVWNRYVDMLLFDSQFKL